MSRTYRRKNFEKTQGRSWDRAGDKIAGYYTERDYNWFSGDRVTYREPTKQERHKTFQWAHGESKSANSRTPSRWFRQARETRMRSHNRKEILKYYKNPDYEPLVHANPMSHLWDWS